MGLAIMIAGLALFLAPHVLTTLREPRAALVAGIGETPYKLVYSVVSLLGILAIAYGFGIYRATAWVEIWTPPVWTRHLAALLVWPAIVMIVAAYSPGRIKIALKHPFLAGIKLWALAHLIANGDLGSLILFGAILAYAVYDRITLKRRSDAGAPAIPVGGVTNDVVAVVGGTILYLLLVFLFHPYVVGVSVF